MIGNTMSRMSFVHGNFNFADAIAGLKLSSLTEMLSSVNVLFSPWQEDK